MNNFLEYLKLNPTVFYIYVRGSTIYNLQNDNSDVDYLVVVDREFVIPDEYSHYMYENHKFRHFTCNVLYENSDFMFFTTDEWFTKVTTGHLYAWECACLPKKFVIKEHVKLMMNTNPLQLRKFFDAELDPIYLLAKQYIQDGEYHKGKKYLWQLIKDVKLINQIIENHKIVNYKEANSDYEKLVNNDCEDEVLLLKAWLDSISGPISTLNKATDGLLLKEKQKKIIQNG